LRGFWWLMLYSVSQSCKVRMRPILIYFLWYEVSILDKKKPPSGGSFYV
jgi:hypothetical protein